MFGGIIETIKEAATNKRTVMIQYVDGKGIVTYRETEPYEIKDGAYFGYDVEKSGIRRFTISQIQSARMTDSTFIPQWPIKI